MEKIRIICPDSHLNKKERIEYIIEEFEKIFFTELLVG